MARRKKDPVLTDDEVKEIVDTINGDDLIEIENPLKDFRIVQNEIDISIKAGEPVTIPRKFLRNLVTEKVIDKLPEQEE